jgi:hypothetical protein
MKCHSLSLPRLGPQFIICGKTSKTRFFAAEHDLALCDRNGNLPAGTVVECVVPPFASSDLLCLLTRPRCSGPSSRSITHPLVWDFYLQVRSPSFFDERRRTPTAGKALTLTSRMSLTGPQWTTRHDQGQQASLRKSSLTILWLTMSYSRSFSPRTTTSSACVPRRKLLAALADRRHLPQDENGFDQNRIQALSNGLCWLYVASRLAVHVQVAQRSAHPLTHATSQLRPRDHGRLAGRSSLSCRPGLREGAAADRDRV